MTVTAMVTAGLCTFCLYFRRRRRPCCRPRHQQRRAPRPPLLSPIRSLLSRPLEAAPPPSRGVGWHRLCIPHRSLLRHPADRWQPQRRFALFLPFRRHRVLFVQARLLYAMVTVRRCRPPGHPGVPEDTGQSSKIGHVAVGSKEGGVYLPHQRCARARYHSEQRTKQGRSSHRQLEFAETAVPWYLAVRGFRCTENENALIKHFFGAIR